MPHQDTAALENFWTELYEALQHQAAPALPKNITPVAIAMASSFIINARNNDFIITASGQKLHDLVARHIIGQSFIGIWDDRSQIMVNKYLRLARNMGEAFIFEAQTHLPAPHNVTINIMPSRDETTLLGSVHYDTAHKTMLHHSKGKLTLGKVKETLTGRASKTYKIRQIDHFTIYSRD